jgi:very-short-patch-repair endonuclease
MKMDATVSSESKALRLARYLKEFVGLRSTTVYDINRYESVLWFGDMPQEPQCQSAAWSQEFETGDPWLVVHKQQLPKPPAPPDVILPWIDQQALKQAADDMPTLRPTRLEPNLEVELGEGEEPPLVERRLDDYPEIVAAYDRYRPNWEIWSKEHQRRSRIQSVYAELFRMHTQVHKQGEIIELVLGLGLLVWRGPAKGKSPPILRHIVTARVDLHFDAATGIMQLKGAADGAQLKIEDDMLDAELRPGREHYAAVGEQLNAIGDDIWDRPSMFAALKSWAAALHPDSEWFSELKISIGSENKPLVIFAPALVMRKRTQAGMVRIYDSLIDRLSRSAAETPSGWSDLVDDEDDQRSFESPPLDETTAAPHPDSEELYFPLPANREQRRIVEAINRQRGVLVQGPPGTGKSHTIANLVCHLLASGKRVLITAETGRALKVLKEKLPEDMQPLCISLLGQGGDAFAELNSAVQSITTRFAEWNPGKYDERIAEVDRELDSNRRSLSKIDTELRSLREDETYPHSLSNGSYTGTASAIALRVTAERERFGWLQLPRNASDNPAVTQAEMAMWLRVCRTYDNDSISASTLRVVGTDKLPAPAEFGTAVTAERQAKATVDRTGDLRAHPAYGPLFALNAAKRAELAETLRKVTERRRMLLRLGHHWLLGALSEALEGRRARWQALLDHSRQLVDRLVQLLDTLGSRSVSIPAIREARSVRADAIAVIEYLNGGGKWTTFGLLTPKAVKDRTYLRDDITVDGRPADTPERLNMVCVQLDLTLAFNALEVAWSDHHGLPSGSQSRIRIAAIGEHVDSLSLALNYAKVCQEMDRYLGSLRPIIPEPNWLNEEADKWLELIEVSTLEERHRLATEQRTACLRDLRAARDLSDTHQVVTSLVHAVEERDVVAYSRAYEQVRQIEQTRNDQEIRKPIESALGSAVPGLIGAVARSIVDTAWDDRFADWEHAWRWAAADNWLGKRTDFSYRQKLWQRRDDTDGAIGTLLAESAALRAWTHFFNRLSRSQSAALKSWREAVRAMGKGTGRSARMERLRREARKYMEECRDAIPVWIMPRYLVAEMVDPAPGRYDLVIVDEASQLGVESLFLFYISKKMVVVGDDQQISPYGVGIADASVADLQHHYLDGIPHQHALSAQSSLYANAKIRFGQNIVLREHFRCMPEIIQFSNDLCYANNGTPLDPLRAYPANRLQPLVVRHIPDGYRTGSSQNALNEPEADAVLAQIVACIADARYAGLTMGVISLQGDAQAKLIEHKLLENLEPEVIEKRRLICGDAYAFQGDERHIIFLSMVAAPGEARIGVLSNDSARQRFNVAASRAQDQLWLFHSATLDILSPACMRHRLLSYMLNPGRQAAAEGNLRFDSQFERDVFQLIDARGYYVRTQVSVGDPTNHRYRIDLVVEGMQGRLAVECDGDEWHGVDRYEQDMARQRDLERAGWQFVRIRGGEFYRDRNKATEPLWSELDRLGVKPGGIDEGAAEPPPPADVHNIERAEADVVDLVSVSPAVVRVDLDSTDADSEPSIEQQVEFDGVVRREPLGARQPTDGLLSDYISYGGPIGPDPRTVSIGEVADGLCLIIEAEGPMIVKRTYDIYLRGCGIKRLGGELKSTMNKALASVIRQGRVVSENEPGNTGLIFSTVRSKGGPRIKLRVRGPRTFEEIPPGELRAVGRHLCETRTMSRGSDEHLRAILEYFDLKRLTTQVGTVLLEILDRPNVENFPQDGTGASQ